MVKTLFFRFMSAVKDKRRLRVALLLVALGVMLVAFSAAATTNDDARTGTATLEEYKKDLYEMRSVHFKARRKRSLR